MRHLFITLVFIGLAQLGFAQAEFKFNETTHDFGTIIEGPDATFDFIFTNTGNEPLVIQNCSASCGCTTPDWTKTPIPPGQKGTISVKYSTKGRIGAINKTVYIQSNAKSDKERFELYIRGTVIKKEDAKGKKVNKSNQ